jgi:hypothetical protein
MNTTPTHAESPEDLDRLFSDFFKAQLKRPWPNAPVPASGASAKPTEPSELVAARTAETPRSAPAPARRDNSARARFTLAASVALLLGTCWYLSNGFAPGLRSGSDAPNPGAPKMLLDGGANDTGVLPEVEKIKAIEGAPKIDMDKFE